MIFMQEFWQKIESWLTENYPKGLKKLNKGASDALLQKTEKRLSVTFLEDLREFYKIHNGTKEDLGLLDGLLSLEEIQEQWEIWKDLTDEGTFDEYKSEPQMGIRDDWWNPGWIPITHDGGGNHICLDMNPADGGRVGQMITMWHDSSERELVADSFRQWVEEYAAALEAGEYVYSPEEYAAIVRVEDVSE